MQAEWSDFKKWWVSKQSNEMEENSSSSYEHHPLLSPAMNIGNCVIAVIDIKTMRYIYTSPNWSEYLGWNNDDFQKGGVQFGFSRVHPEDQIGVTVFSALINTYFKKLPDAEKGHYRSFWDFRIRSDGGQYFKGLQQDCSLKYNADGLIEELLLFYYKIENVTSAESQHLRLTNGKENVFYKYDHALKANIQLQLLSEREMEIVKLIAKSKSLKQIADVLNISFNTVKVHHANALHKMQVKNSIELVSLLRTWAFI